jgi:hypothetical protein
VGIFVVASGGSFAYLDFIVVIPEGFFIVPVPGCEIGQYPDMGAVVVAVFPLAAAYGGGNKMVKLSVPANQEF